ncbi:hypothetical protein ABEX38_29215 [Priestia megaterium]
MIGLEETYNVLVEKNKIENKYHQLIASEKPKGINIIAVLIILFAIGCIAIMGFWIMEIIRPYTNYSTSIFIKVGNTILGIILMVITAIVYTAILLIVGVILKVINIIIFFFIRKTDSHRQKVGNINKEKVALELEYQRLNTLLYDSIVPDDYKSLDAVEFMGKCINQGRANTIGDAINLYVSECQHNQKLEIMRENQRINEQKQRIHEKEINTLKKEVAKANRTAREAKGTASLVQIRSLFK